MFDMFSGTALLREQLAKRLLCVRACVHACVRVCMGSFVRSCVRACVQMSAGLHLFAWFNGGNALS